MDLKDIRKDIDAIDTQICDLFKRKMNLVKKKKLNIVMMKLFLLLKVY